nr:MAG TPA: hypothetical protein [Caudoviricetes sp.]
MPEIVRVESIDAKPSEFFEVHEYIAGIVDDIDRAVVRLFDKDANIRINIYYYLTEGSILVYWSERYCPRNIKFGSGEVGSMYAAFDELKGAVSEILENDHS